jgi:hypothetical protein
MRDFVYAVVDIQKNEVVYMNHNRKKCEAFLDKYENKANSGIGYKWMSK